MKNLSKLSELPQTARYFVSSIFFTSFDDSQRTKLTGEDAENKEDMLDFFNVSMEEYGKHIIEAFTDVPVTNPFIAIVEDIYQEGVLMRYLTTDDIELGNDNKFNEKQLKQLTKNIAKNPASTTIFIPFRTKEGNPYRRFYVLLAEAQIKLGIFDGIVSLFITSPSERHDFTVTNTEFVSKNMLRIHIKSESVLPNNEPGYAYRFALTKSSKLHNKKNRALAGNDWLNMPIQFWEYAQPMVNHMPYAKKALNQGKKYAFLTALEVFKRLPHKRREQQQADQKVAKSSPSTTVEKRYYTLRQLKSNTDPFSGQVDIYIHDETPGSVWARSLQAGDRIKIDSHYLETIKEMTIGQPLLICDETSMPSVAAVLEQWQSNSVPIVISITNDPADFVYFDEIELPEQLENKLNIHHINAREVDNLAESIIELIKQQHKKIDCAWGAIGKADFKAIKKYLREDHKLTGKLNRIRAYWV